MTWDSPTLDITNILTVGIHSACFDHLLRPKKWVSTGDHLGELLYLSVESSGENCSF